MKKPATLYLIISFVILLFIGIAIGYSLGQNKPNKSVPPRYIDSSPANDLPASTNKPVTKEGTIGCLKTSGDGPQTMDCAIGLTTADGTQYGLGSDDPTLTGSVPTGTTIRVTGTLSEPTGTKYNTAGTIHVTTLTKL
ncbi:hypothetical protein EYC59_04415 [Candidatus Saccharibacteria bacterium]|nr:MAG: hypothetical protein EYC59_04415 [Candidatus Saccharibacteria bacterium]